jgi:hypothetical protein
LGELEGGGRIAATAVVVRGDETREAVLVCGEMSNLGPVEDIIIGDKALGFHGPGGGVFKVGLFCVPLVFASEAVGEVQADAVE